MPPFVRSILAIIAGGVIAFGVIAAVQYLSSLLFPAPPGMDMTDPAALREFMAALPLGAFLMVLLSYVFGGLAGGFVAARLAPWARTGHAVAIAVLLAAASVVNLRMVPHPTWFMIANLAVVVLLPLAGARLAARGRTEPAVR